jgi:hypothetical protein
MESESFSGIRPEPVREHKKTQLTINGTEDWVKTMVEFNAECLYGESSARVVVTLPSRVMAQISCRTDVRCPLQPPDELAELALTKINML